MANNYVVKPGDSLSKIAKNLGVSIGDISGYSSGDPNLIRVGESLTVGSPKPKSAPKGSLASGTQDIANDALKYGAAGRGEFDSNLGDIPSPDSTPDGQREGESNTQYKARILKTPYLYSNKNSATGYGTVNPKTGKIDRVPTLSKAESAAIMKNYGISGLGADYTGMTEAQARKAAELKKNQLLGAATLGSKSSFFDVSKLKNIKGTSDALNKGLLALKNDPWKTKEDKQLTTKEELDKATSAYAGLFSDPEDFISSYQSNPQLSSLMTDYVKAGGTAADVAQKIAMNQTTPSTGNQSVADYLSNGNQEVSVIKDTQNADGTRSVQYSDGTRATVRVTKNADGSESYSEVPGAGNLMTAETSGAGDNVYTSAADRSLSATRSQTIDEINRLARVPQDQIDLYYGTPEKMGVLQKQKLEAENTIKELNKASKNSTKDTKSEFNIEIERQRQERDIEIADLEEKRLQMKTYLTGRLADLGALVTTGEAPVALANLDQKYEKSKTTTRNNFNYNQSKLISQRNQAISKIESDLAKSIADIKSDLNKSEEEIQKDILKEQAAASKAINSEVEQFNTKAKSTYTQFLNTSSNASQQYIKEFLKTASGGMSAEYMKQFTQGLNALSAKKKSSTSTSTKGNVTSGSLTLTPADISEGSRTLESSRGSDGYVNSATYTAMYTKWINGGGLAKDFIAKFPPKNYVNPQDTSLPPLLRTGKAPSTTTSQKS